MEENHIKTVLEEFMPRGPLPWNSFSHTFERRFAPAIGPDGNGRATAEWGSAPSSLGTRLADLRERICSGPRRASAAAGTRFGCYGAQGRLANTRPAQGGHARNRDKTA